MIDECSSAFTIDRRTGEKLTCQLPLTRHVGRHLAEYESILWYWTDAEQDS